MAKLPPHLTGKTVSFSPDELIVSKTDLRGVITYVNDVFMRVSGYNEAELIGAPHRILRHPAMPRCVFKLLWDTIQQQQEVFAYILNRTKGGDEYWVFAHVTPSFDVDGGHVGYHSSRRSPYLDALPAVKVLYSRLLTLEERYTRAAEAAQAGLEALNEILSAKGTTYDQFIFSLSRETSLAEGAK